MCTEVVGLPFLSRIEEVFDQVHGLLQFSIERDVLIKKIRMSLTRYTSKNFELFPPMLTSQLTIVDKQNWASILKDNMDLRMNTVINDDQTNLWFARTTKEIVTIGLFFNSFKDDFINLRVFSKSVTKKESSILHFDWLDEEVYSQ